MKGIVCAGIAVQAFLGLLVTGVGRADVIARWDFNDSNLIVDEGIGTLSVSFPPADVGFFAGTTKNAPVGVLAGQALGLKNRTNNKFGRLDFQVSMTGRAGLVVSLASQKTSTGFNSNQLAYSVDGGANFVNYSTPLNPPLAFDSAMFDLSNISTFNNNPNTVIRLTFDGATTAAGNNRLDNIQFAALTNLNTTATPEPPTLVLGCLAGCMLLGRRLARWLKPVVSLCGSVAKCGTAIGRPALLGAETHAVVQAGFAAVDESPATHNPLGLFAFSE